MRNFNQVVMEGRLVNELEIKYTNSDIMVANFTVAINRSWKDSNGEKKEEVDYIEARVWNKLAERCVEYLAKGQLVRVIGELRQQRWTTEANEPRSKIVVNVNLIDWEYREMNNNE
jgi:single-strand DNA-binding protein|tara:strand:- start:157 stop:504 length:348 start_codon:yes stop_codon:yes gene_type:complete